MNLILAVILFPVVVLVAILVISIGFVAWVCGAPLTLKFGDHRESYRWFTRIK